MARKRAKTQKDFWQLSLRSVWEEDGHGTALEVYNPIDGTHKVVKLMGDEMSHRKTIKQLAIAFVKKNKSGGDRDPGYSPANMRVDNRKVVSLSLRLT